MKPIAFRTAFGAACVVFAIAGAAPSASAQSGPFNGLEGAWSGAGTVELADGTSERIRCRATYKVGGGGQAVEQSLRCASDSYKIDLSSSLRSQGGTVSGQWTESNRNVFGSVQGRAEAGQINVLVEAAGFAANLQLTTRGNKQSVAITSKGEIKNVSISMSKG